MCIFSQPVVSVNDTRIFARLTGQGSQLLAYQMHYESRDSNAMILPIPVQQPANAESLRFIALDDYDDFFEDLDLGFPLHQQMSIGCSSNDLELSDNHLEVFEVGSYIASFVPTLAEFSRLDPQFRLPEETWASIPKYEGYGFAVFQLVSGAKKPHPMAFEYKTTWTDLYFPTMHIHDGEVKATEQFDHVLYLQHAGFDSSVYGYRNCNLEDSVTHWVRSQRPASKVCDMNRAAGLLAGDLLLHRKLLRGERANDDIVVKAWGDPLNPTFNFRYLSTYAPWLVMAFATLAWFFHRRSVVKKRIAERP